MAVSAAGHNAASAVVMPAWHPKAKRFAGAMLWAMLFCQQQVPLWGEGEIKW